MFVYFFTNPLFISEQRKIVSSFPLPNAFIWQLAADGWARIDLDAALRPDLF